MFAMCWTDTSRWLGGCLDLIGDFSTASRKGVLISGQRGVEETFILAAEGATNVAFGPFAPFAKILLMAAREAHQGKGVRHRDLEETRERSAADELCRELGWLMDGKQSLPTIVWLDDAPVDRCKQRRFSGEAVPAGEEPKVAASGDCHALGAGME